MKVLLSSVFLCGIVVAVTGQTRPTVSQPKLSPELLWELHRISGTEVSPDYTQILYGSTTYDIKANKGDRDLFVMNINGGEAHQITNFPGSEFNAVWRPDGEKIGFLSAKDGSVQLYEINPDGRGVEQVSNIEGGINGFKYAPDGNSIVYIQDVKLDQTINEKYPDLPHAQVNLFDDLMYRHWDSWHDYSYSHAFVSVRSDKGFTAGKDIMEGQRYDTPMNPFGGMEQIAWAPDGRSVYYTTKQLNGVEYATSTNSDIFQYDIRTGKTTNLLSDKGFKGYDINPSFSPDGQKMSWLSMEEEGFESDKNDIIVAGLDGSKPVNLTKDIDLTVSDFVWDDEGETIYFKAVKDATYQFFSLDVESKEYQQITQGQHNYTSIAFAGKSLVGTRQSMMTPNEVYKVNLKKREQVQLTFENKDIFEKLGKVSIEKRMIKTTDGKDMLTWVIYPPNFDKTKKYPTILYCQGGPQSAVSQFFSFRWNFNLMASQGYIIVAPNRRGLPGFGQQWNDDISGDWGGQPMRDYLSAIDELAKESYVDEDNLGCIGASYGGYSVYYLAGIHEKRFKCFISHCGLFNLESWYGSTEELFFANKDIGGPYWDKDVPESYGKYSPHKFAKNWDTPMLVIHGEKDYRVPVTQGMEAFQVCQTKGIPSKFLHFPTEGHWVLSPQNGLVWHREFFSWLDAWLKVTPKTGTKQVEKVKGPERTAH